MSGAIENEATADVELWTLYQWLCHDCPVIDGVPTAYGDAETLAEAQRAIIRHKTVVHHEWDPAPTMPDQSSSVSRVQAEADNLRQGVKDFMALTDWFMDREKALRDLCDDADETGGGLRGWVLTDRIRAILDKEYPGRGASRG